MNTLKSNLDATDWAILRELQEDARLSYAEIGRRVGLSSPAVQERIRRMEDSGIIEGYHAKVNVKALSLTLMGIIRFTNIDNYETQQHLTKLIQEIPEVTACYRVTGEDEFIVHVHAQSMEHMSAIKSNFSQHARLVTSIVIKSHVDRRTIALETFPYLEHNNNAKG